MQENLAFPEDIARVINSYSLSLDRIPVSHGLILPRSDTQQPAIIERHGRNMILRLLGLAFFRGWWLRQGVFEDSRGNKFRLQ